MKGLVLGQQTEIFPPKFLKSSIMKKYTLAALFLVASMSVVSAANGAELSLPVNIESVGRLIYGLCESGSHRRDLRWRK